jgi:hypothetical protein
MTYEVVPDKEVSGSWRVEAIDYQNEGVGYIAIFAGPSAQQRAEEYADWKTAKSETRAA